jgi:hypothetical protein
MRNLNQRGLDLEAEFQMEFAGQGCTCFLSPPCEHCLHPGHPLALEADDSLWYEVREPRARRKARKKAKLEARGTYRHHDEWARRKREEDIIASAKSLLQSIARQTGKTTLLEPFLKDIHFTRHFTHPEEQQ